MTKYIIYNELGRRKLTTEDNYNTCMQNASKIIDVSNFASPESVEQYLINEWKLLPSQIIIKSGTI